MCTMCVSCVDGGQPPCGSWELNSGLLQEQQIFLIAESSLQLFTYFWNKQKAPLNSIVIHQIHSYKHINFSFSKLGLHVTSSNWKCPSGHVPLFLCITKKRRGPVWLPLSGPGVYSDCSSVPRSGIFLSSLEEHTWSLWSSGLGICPRGETLQEESREEILSCTLPKGHLVMTVL